LSAVLVGKKPNTGGTNCTLSNPIFVGRQAV